MKSDSPRFRAALLQQIEQERFQRLMDFTHVLRENELTYLKFAFKTEERQENIHIKEFQRSTNLQSTGTMNICDLWSTTQINRYLDISKFTKDKFLLQKLAKQNNRVRVMRQPSPIKSQSARGQSVQKKNFKQIIDELNQLHSDNQKLKYQLNRRIYCKTQQY